MSTRSAYAEVFCLCSCPSPQTASSLRSDPAGLRRASSAEDLSSVLQQQNPPPALRMPIRCAAQQPSHTLCLRIKLSANHILLPASSIACHCGADCQLCTSSRACHSCSSCHQLLNVWPSGAAPVLAQVLSTTVSKSPTIHQMSLACRLGRGGGRPQTIQLAEWWADFDEKFMRPVFSRGDSFNAGPGMPGLCLTSQLCRTVALRPPPPSCQSAAG